LLLGIKSVIAKSFERIHRSSLIGLGILPLQFANGESADSLGLTGKERYDITGLSDLSPGAQLTITATGDDGERKEFEVRARVGSPIEFEYLRNSGILHTVLRQILKKRA
jgi:aconitate hydratase